MIYLNQSSTLILHKLYFKWKKNQSEIPIFLKNKFKSFNNQKLKPPYNPTKQTRTFRTLTHKTKTPHTLQHPLSFYSLQRPHRTHHPITSQNATMRTGIILLSRVLHISLAYASDFQWRPASVSECIVGCVRLRVGGFCNLRFRLCCWRRNSTTV